MSSSVSSPVGSFLHPLRGIRGQHRSRSGDNIPTAREYLEAPRSAMHTRAPSPYSSSFELGPRSAPMVPVAAETGVKENFSLENNPKSSRRRFQVFNSGPRPDESFLYVDGAQATRKQDKLSNSTKPTRTVATKRTTNRLVKERPQMKIERDFIQAPPQLERAHRDVVLDIRPQHAAHRHPSASPLGIPMSPDSGTTVSATRSSSAECDSAPMFFTFEGLDSSSKEPDFKPATEDRYYMSL